MQPHQGMYFVLDNELHMVLYCGEEYIQTENCRTLETNMVLKDEFEELELQCVNLR